MGARDIDDTKSRRSLGERAHVPGLGAHIRCHHGVRFSPGKIRPVPGHCRAEPERSHASAGPPVRLYCRPDPDHSGHDHDRHRHRAVSPHGEGDRQRSDSAAPGRANRRSTGLFAHPAWRLDVPLSRPGVAVGTLKRPLLFACSLAALLLPAGTAWAAEAPAAASEALFVGQVITLILLGRILGELMQRIGQPSVMGQLLAGLLLGPSFLGAFWPTAEHVLFPPSHEQKSMIDGISQIGILLLLLLTGMETDLKLVRRIGRAAIGVSVTGIIVPFICGFFLGQYLPESLLPDPAQRLIGSLFLGTALSISSVKIVAMVVREMNFMRRNVGQIIIASAIIDDTIGWIIIAIIFGLAQHGSIDALALGKSVAGTLLFLAVSLTLGRRFVFWLIRWTNDNLVSEVPVIFVIIVLMGGMALITQWIGVHTVLGAFVAGILVGESPILTRHIDEQLRGLIMGLFMPVFFGLAGLSADLTILKDPMLLELTAGLIVIASVGKFAGAFAGGIAGRLSLRESLALGCGMNARGSTEVIIATIGLSMGVLSHNLYTMIVTMAVVTTMAMPPMLRWGLARLPLREDEKARLDREEYEAKGFVANIERVLLAVDESLNGEFASRLAGLLAGGRGAPTTVLHLTRLASKPVKPEPEEKAAEATVKAAAEERAEAEEEATAVPPTKVQVTTRAPKSENAEAIAQEARKGY